jgi:hypothetical protein
VWIHQAWQDIPRLEKNGQDIHEDWRLLLANARSKAAADRERFGCLSSSRNEKMREFMALLRVIVAPAMTKTKFDPTSLVPKVAAALAIPDGRAWRTAVEVRGKINDYAKGLLPQPPGEEGGCPWTDHARRKLRRDRMSPLHRAAVSSFWHDNTEPSPAERDVRKHRTGRKKPASLCPLFALFWAWPAVLSLSNFPPNFPCPSACAPGTSRTKLTSSTPRHGTCTPSSRRSIPRCGAAWASSRSWSPSTWSGVPRRRACVATARTSASPWRPVVPTGTCSSTTTHNAQQRRWGLLGW